MVGFAGFTHPAKISFQHSLFCELSFSASHGPHIVGVGLIVVVHVAVVEVYVPGVGRVVCVRRGRPIVVRLDALSVHFSRFSSGVQKLSEAIFCIPLAKIQFLGGAVGMVIFRYFILVISA